jgi:hypothetical protein
MTKERIPILLLFTASLFLPDLPFYIFSTAEDKMTATKAPSARELRLPEQHRKCIYRVILSVLDSSKKNTQTYSKQ